MANQQPFQASLRCSLALKQVEALLKQLAKLSAGIAEYQDEPCPTYLEECQVSVMQVLSTTIDIALLLGVPVSEIHNATK
jgi:hypothetical protein